MDNVLSSWLAQIIQIAEKCSRMKLVASETIWSMVPFGGEKEFFLPILFFFILWENTSLGLAYFSISVFSRLLPAHTEPLFQWEGSPWVPRWNSVVPGAGATGRGPGEPSSWSHEHREPRSTSSKFSKCSPFSKYVRLKKTLSLTISLPTQQIKCYQGHMICSSSLARMKRRDIKNGWW